MFENLGFPAHLSEDLFEEWLVKGRDDKIRYSYLVILWDDLEKDYRPVYVPDREGLEKYNEMRGTVGDVLVAAYDLYSESKIF